MNSARSPSELQAVLARLPDSNPCAVQARKTLSYALRERELGHVEVARAVLRRAAVWVEHAERRAAS